MNKWIALLCTLRLVVIQVVLLPRLITLSITLHIAEKLLDTQNSPLVVAISGRVASESTIECELSGLKCVIVEEAVHMDI